MWRFDDALHHDLTALFAGLRKETDAGAVVITGRGRAFSASENAELATAAVITGADYERGARPPQRAPVVAAAVDACPVPAGRAAPVKP